jgi:hypothetical protein
LQQSRLGVTSDDVQRQEHGENGAEEQGREHREPEDDCARELVGIEIRFGRPDEVARVLERLVRAPRVQPEEHERQDEHDGEHLAAQALPQAVEDNRRQSTTSR